MELLVSFDCSLHIKLITAVPENVWFTVYVGCVSAGFPVRNLSLHGSTDGKERSWLVGGNNSDFGCSRAGRRR